MFAASAAGGYAEAEASALFPGLDLQVMLGFLDQPTATQAMRAYRRHLRA